MQNTDIRRNIEHLRQALADNGYSKGRILQFNSTTNQLLKFMAQHGISKYSMDVGIRFIGEQYGFRADGTLSHVNQGRLQDLTMLSEMQVHGTYMMRTYLEEREKHFLSQDGFPLFQNRSGKKLTRAGVAYILNKYVTQAQQMGTIPTQMTVSPHILRHSKAMHLLQSGVNLIYIRDLLGHADVSTTEVYARADEHFKRKALTLAYPSPVPMLSIQKTPGR